jgi:hypothetical protein
MVVNYWIVEVDLVDLAVRFADVRCANLVRERTSYGERVGKKV